MCGSVVLKRKASIEKDALFLIVESSGYTWRIKRGALEIEFPLRFFSKKDEALNFVINTPSFRGGVIVFEDNTTVLYMVRYKAPNTLLAAASRHSLRSPIDADKTAIFYA